MSKQLTTCIRSDCFACERGRCVILTSTFFGDRLCPFFKHRKQYEKERDLPPRTSKEGKDTNEI